MQYPGLLPFAALGQTAEAEATLHQVAQTSNQKEEKRSIALNFLREGVSIEAVVHGTDRSIEAVQQLQQQMNEPAQS